MGKLIVIEGMDGAGTTTQTKMLGEYLAKMNFKVLCSSEPSQSPIGREIRQMLAMPLEKKPHLLTSLALCFAADRMHHIHHVLAPGLLAYDFVVVDRYVLSSLVYQGLHLPNSFVREINQFAIKPDLCLVLDLPVEAAMSRLSSRVGAKDFYEKAEVLKQVRERYLHFSQAHNTAIIDAAGSINQVLTHIVHLLKQEGFFA